MVEIKKLVLKNFKSFRSAEIPFKKGLTAIIGPNGSGKSNLLDAMLFVLGETSMKSLRMGKITELVNYSSAEKYAKVELKLKRDNEEILISRLIDNKGRSECRINDKKVTLNELVSLVEELGLRSKHNFIAQGDITRIIEMNPEQRRTIIDELAGIEEFEIKRKEAQLNLDKVNERIKDVKLVLQEKLARLEQLQKEREQAERYKGLVERRNMLKASIINSEAKAIKQEIEKNKERLRLLQEKVSKRSSEKESISKKISEFEKKSEELSKSIVEEQQQIYLEFGAKAEELRTEIRVSEEIISANSKAVGKIESQENSLATELQSLLRRQEEEQQQIEAIRLEIEEQNSIINSMESEIQQKKKDSEALSLRKAEIEEEIRSIEQEIENLQDTIKTKQKEFGEIKGENDLREKRIKELSAELTDCDQLRTSISNLKEQLNVLESKSLEEKLKKLKELERDLLTKDGLQTGLINQLKEAIVSIESASAKCPICDSNINPERKKKLHEKKLKELKNSEMQKASIVENLKEIRNKIKETELELGKLSKISQELQAKEKEIKRVDEIKLKIEEEKRSIKDLKVLSGEISALEQKISSLNRIRTEKRELLDELSDFSYDDKYSQLAELKDQLSTLESNLRVSEVNIENIAERIATLRARINELSSEKQQLNKQKEEKTKALESLKKELAKIEEKKLKRSEQIASLLEEKEGLLGLIQKLKTELNLVEADSVKAERESNEIRIEIGKAEVRLADLEEELKEIPKTQIIEDVPIKDMKKMLSDVDRELNTIGAVNLRASEAVREEEELLLEVKSKIEKLEEEQKAVIDMIQKIEIRKKEIFMDCFEKINKNFSDMFYNFFGGTGKLSLTDYEDISKAGLIIEARHKENLQSIDAMSGGEKTLTALAFIFAILLYAPAPLYFLDETDAALDEVNSIKVSKVLEELSKKSHIIVITHNNVVVRYAMQVLGVTLTKSGSQIVGLDLTKHLSDVAQQ
ncbi:MAG: chromosome segregation protein SMC [Candidatus Diapherotrites archaeon]|nr:chromosome segregation protein SMC [Candidatus Diapherotrites archaeon]